MSSEHIVVDGSNIATEGRSAPSLAQLEEAVAELRREFPDAEVTVIVDATFSHRIDPSELERFEQAALEGEYVHPPAGAIGRGDAFLLRIAQKVDSIVLSNDSFQEFHGEHPWLFERGRLIGATPVPGVGWIFTPRTPVRGPTSRRAVKDTDKAKRKVSRAIEAATKEAVSPQAAAPREGARRRVAKKVAGETAEADVTSPRKRQRSAPPASTPAAVNDPLTFVSFIAEHPLGKEVTARVDSYTSHGAVVFAGTVQCYVPLANMGVPAPRSAREILKRDEERVFVVTALDPLRRGVELALPGIAVVSGRPSDEMIAAEVKLAKKASGPRKKATARVKKAAPVAATGRGKKAAPAATEAPPPATEAPPPATKAAPPGKKAAPSGPLKKASTAKKAAAVAKRVRPDTREHTGAPPASPADEADSPGKRTVTAKKAARKPAAKSVPGETSPPRAKAAPPHKATRAIKAAPPAAAEATFAAKRQPAARAAPARKRSSQPKNAARQTADKGRSSEKSATLTTVKKMAAPAKKAVRSVTTAAASATDPGAPRRSPRRRASG